MIGIIGTAPFVLLMRMIIDIPQEAFPCYDNFKATIDIRGDNNRESDACVQLLHAQEHELASRR